MDVQSIPYDFFRQNLPGKTVEDAKMFLNYLGHSLEIRKENGKYRNSIGGAVVIPTRIHVNVLDNIVIEVRGRG